MTGSAANGRGAAASIPAMPPQRAMSQGVAVISVEGVSFWINR